MNHIKLLQMYAEAESRANEFIQIAMPRHNSISAEGKYIPKTRIMKIKLVQFCFCLFCLFWRSREPRSRGKGVWGGAGKVPQIRGNLVHFPGEKQRKWR